MRVCIFIFYNQSLFSALDRQENGLYTIQTSDQIDPEAEAAPPNSEAYNKAAGDNVQINPAELTNTSVDPKAKRLVRRKSELPQDMNTQRTLQQYNTLDNDDM